MVMMMMIKKMIMMVAKMKTKEKVKRKNRKQALKFENGGIESQLLDLISGTFLNFRLK